MPTTSQSLLRGNSSAKFNVYLKRSLLHLVHYSETEYEWISTKWLKDWMNEKTETPPVDNSSLLCSHGK